MVGGLLPADSGGSVVFARCASWAAAVALLAGALGGGVASAANDTPSSCNGPLRLSDRYHVDFADFDATGAITFGGTRLVLTGTGTDYTVNDPARRTWTLWFRSWVWLGPLVAEGRAEDAVRLATQWHAAVPDPGGQAGRSELWATGWSEGAVTQRMQSVLCVWQATRDPALIPVMTDLARANMDPMRYYGLPRRPPHNHGTMADFALLRAGQAMNVPAWIDFAINRFDVAVRRVFDECGSDAEQSSSYLAHNLQLWERVLRVAQILGIDRLGDVLRQRLPAVRHALASLTLPGGRVPVVGDGSVKQGLAPARGTPTQWWCPDRGWAAGRDSWERPRVHYTLHFGAAPRFHGHDDHGSVTWWTDVNGGALVLTDRGPAPKDSPAAVEEFAQSKASHSVLYPAESTWTSSSSASRETTKTSWRFTVTDGSRNSDAYRIRTIDIRRDRPVLVVTDEGHGTVRQGWRQTWQLHPDWQPAVNAEWGVIARHPNGSVLQAICAWSADQRDLQVPELSRVPDYASTDIETRGLAATCQRSGRDVRVSTVLAVGTTPLSREQLLALLPENGR